MYLKLQNEGGLNKYLNTILSRFLVHPVLELESLLSRILTIVTPGSLTMMVIIHLDCNLMLRCSYIILPYYQRWNDRPRCLHLLPLHLPISTLLHGTNRATSVAVITPYSTELLTLGDCFIWLPWLDVTTSLQLSPVISLALDLVVELSTVFRFTSLMSS